MLTSALYVLKCFTSGGMSRRFRSRWPPHCTGVAAVRWTVVKLSESEGIWWQLVVFALTSGCVLAGKVPAPRGG